MRNFILTCVVAFCICPASPGEILEIEDKDQWIAAVGDYTTIDFTGFPIFTPITDQYKKVGVLFVDPANTTSGPNPAAYPNDGWGLDGNVYIELSFTAPQNWIGVDSPSDVLIQLFLDGEFVNAGAAQGPGFEGVISDRPFNAAIIRDFDDDLINPDDLYFGAQAPGDVNNDGAVNVADLLEVVLTWGLCPAEDLCFADLDDDGFVEVEDLIAVLAHWE